MTEPMFLAGARALASIADAADPSDGLLPDIGRLREVSATVAVAVVESAIEQGLAREVPDDPIEAVHEAMWHPVYPTLA
jgi:malate dehydrogenase (oxaloacetate-decarboxylating)